MNDDLELLEDDDEDNLANTYLTFSIANEDYALHVAHVIEIVRLQRIFAVPDVGTHIRGVINLRGKVIPLLDVRARFGLPEEPYTDRTVVVVIQVGDSPTGLVVDGVFDISEIPPDRIEPAPPAVRSSPTSLVTGLGKRDDRVSFIIDVPALVSPTSLRTPSTPSTQASSAL